MKESAGRRTRRSRAREKDGLSLPVVFAGCEHPLWSSIICSWNAAPCCLCGVGCWAACQTTALARIILQILIFQCKIDSDSIQFEENVRKALDLLKCGVKQISKLVAKWHFCPFIESCVQPGEENDPAIKNIPNSLGLYRSKNGSAFDTGLTNQIPPPYWSIPEWRKRKNIFPPLQLHVEFR